jgi:hypothetical protein
MRTTFSIVALALLVACGGGGSSGSSSPQTLVPYITTGGSGLTVSPGPCIASGSISATNVYAAPGPWTVFSVVSHGPRGGYEVTGTRGANSPTFFHAKAGETITVLGATLTLVDPAPARGTNQGFAVSVRESN